MSIIPDEVSARNQPLTAEQINQAIAWYEVNAEAVAAALPISVPGTRHKVGCLVSLNRFIVEWKDGKMPVNLATCYIHRPLTIFYKDLKSD